METYTFTLILDGPPLSDAHVDALFQAGCDDAAFGGRGQLQVAEFDREAPTIATALVSAILQIESTVKDLSVIRVEPDDFVTQAVIAERTGRSRESVRLLVSGERGPGGFPEPLTWVDGKTQIWHWSQVTEWFDAEKNEAIEQQGSGAPQFVAALNGVLEARKQLRNLSSLAAESGPEAHLAFSDKDVRALPDFVTDSAELLASLT